MPKKQHTIFIFLFVMGMVLSGCDLFSESPPPLPTPTPTQNANVPRPVDTVAPVLPTPTLVPAVLPTATDDPNSAEWTILIYMDADNNLEPYALDDLNEIVSGEQTEDINIVVQIDRAEGYSDAAGDWTNTRRFINSSSGLTEIEELGELNMADPNTLTEFIQFGLATYPAERVALVMWGHGSGWLGMTFDVSADSSRLSMTQLESAIAAGIGPSNRDKLDVIGFDACLMGQLEVFSAVQNSAEFAVASEELVPSGGWNYANLLQSVRTNPQMDGRELSQTMVGTYGQHYRGQGDQDVTLSAIELANLPALTNSVETLATVLQNDITANGAVISDARTGGQTFARYFRESQPFYGAIDLWRFAAIVSQMSPDEAVRNAANNVMLAIADAVTENSQGPDLEFAEGMAIYFPKSAEFYNATYATEINLPAWNSLIQSYHSLPAIAPELTITSAPTSSMDSRNPAFLGYEIRARQLEDVVILAGRYENGRRLLLEYDRLIPEPITLADGSQLTGEWRDGVHEDFYIWEGRVTYLTDDEQGDFVIMWPTSADSTQFTVQGDYLPSDGSAPIRANLVFDHLTNELVQVWGGDVAAPAEILPQSGDRFRVWRYFLDGNDAILPENGVELDIDRLRYDWRTVPDGDYFLGFSAETNTATSSDFVDIRLDSATDPGDADAYLDPYLGYQFIYPSDWLQPVYGEFDNTLLFTSDVSGTVSFQVKVYAANTFATDLSGTPVTSDTIKQDILSQWQNVSLLYEDQTTAANEGVQRTVYGYTAADGQRTGMLLTFAHRGLGFAVDVDLPAEREAELVGIVQRVLESWEFRPVGIGLYPARWAALANDSAETILPEGFTRTELENGWQRLQRPDESSTFIALRSDPASGRDPAALAVYWVDLASNGLTDVAVSQPSAFAVGGLVWTRYDFTYTNRNGTPISGLLMTTQTEQELVYWAETPTDKNADFENLVLSLISASVTVP